MWNILEALSLLGCLALSLVSCSAFGGTATPEPRPTLPMATLPASIQPRDIPEFYPTELASTDRGRLVYDNLCAECHGDGGMGNGPRAGQLGIDPSDFTAPELRAEVPPSWYFRAITNGVVGTAMLGWKSQLIEQQRWDVTFYVWSLASSPESIAQGRDLYREHCASCHGRNGLGNGPRAGGLEQPATPLADPRFLAGQSGEELLGAVAGDVTDVDHDWSAELTKSELQSIINFIWTFLYR